MEGKAIKAAKVQVVREIIRQLQAKRKAAETPEKPEASVVDSDVSNLEQTLAAAKVLYYFYYS